jgi:hypothetical protein
MKKLLFLFVAGSLALSASAQEKLINFGNSVPGSLFNYQDAKKVIRAEVDNHKHQQKTTAAPRWYSYADYFDTSEIDLGTGAAISSTYMWKDTMAVMAYNSLSSPTWQHNRLVSMGLVVDPTFSGFNSLDYYSGQMKVNPTDAYSVDSLRFFGIYGFNTANTYVDTLRVAFVYGDASRGNGTSGPDVYLAKTGNPSVLTTYGSSDSMDTYRMHFDSVTTTAKGTTAVFRDILLNNTGASPAWGDTLSNGWYMGQVGFSDVNIPAGNLIGASVTFISGSPTFYAHDTVFGTNGYKHNMFRGFSLFKGSSTSTSYATYVASNRNSGMYKTLPDTARGWGGQFIPLWFWSASSGPSTLQYPYIDFHIKCTSCGTVTGINEVSKITEASAYPNPVSSELTIPFSLDAPASVTISLSNMLGQVVDTRSFIQVSKGKAVFNTEKLAPGLYVFNITSGAQRLTGRVVVVH